MKFRSVNGECLNGFIYDYSTNYVIELTGIGKKATK